MSTNDDQIIRVFRKAAEKGVKTISTDTLLVATNLQRNTINMRLNNLSKYGMVIPVDEPKTTRKWRFNP